MSMPDRVINAVASVFAVMVFLAVLLAVLTRSWDYVLMDSVIVIGLVGWLRERRDVYR